MLEDVAEQAKGHKYAAHATSILGKNADSLLFLRFHLMLF